MERRLSNGPEGHMRRRGFGSSSFAKQLKADRDLETQVVTQLGLYQREAQKMIGVHWRLERRIGDIALGAFIELKRLELYPELKEELGVPRYQERRANAEGQLDAAKRIWGILGNDGDLEEYVQQGWDEWGKDHLIREYSAEKG